MVIPKAIPVDKRMTVLYFLSFVDCCPNAAFEDSLPRNDIRPDGKIDGLISTACLKRFVRDTIPQILDDVPWTVKDPKRFGTYIERMKYIIDKHRKATGNKSTQGNPKLGAKALDWMLEHYFDIRMFGGTLSVGKDGDAEDAAKFYLDNVRGPIRVAIARTIHPLLVLTEEGGTRVVATKPKKRKKDGSVISVANAEVCKTARINYGMYRSLICINPKIATGSKLTQEDVELFLRSLVQWPNVIHSSNRQGHIHRLFVFEHPNALGTAQDYVLQDLVESLTTTSQDVASDKDVQLPTLAEVQKALAKEQKRGLMKGIKVRDVVSEVYGATNLEAA